MGDAQLITPEGKTIILPEYIYVRVMDMLASGSPPPKMTREQVEKIVAETYGILKDKSKAGRPLTEALLESRREEFEREEREIRERQKRRAPRRRNAA